MNSKLFPLGAAIIAISMSGFAQPPDDGGGAPPPPPPGGDMYPPPPPPDDMGGGPPPDAQQGDQAAPGQGNNNNNNGRPGGDRQQRGRNDRGSRRQRDNAPPPPPPAVSSTKSTSGTLELSTLPPAAKEMSFNFRGVPADDVLEAMSKTLGLAVVKNVQITGNVDVVSHQPLQAAEAVTLLNTIIDAQGYAAILNGKTLTIVRRDDARTRSIPVHSGNDPKAIPDTSEMITQIIPVRHTAVKELVPQLESLIPSYATMTANESSNAIVLTDTQSGVRHIVEIVQALDESISEISQIHVYALDYADAKEVADTITKLFEPPTTSTSGRNGGGGFPGGGFFGRRDDNAAQPAGSTSVAMQANSRVVAVSDDRTNSLVVSAPDALRPAIDALVKSLDHSQDLLTDVQVFPLKNANATDMSTVIMNVFAPSTSTTTQGRNGQNVNRRFPGFGGQQQPQPAAGATTPSEHSKAETTVLAVADTRTNSVVVSASTQSMDLIASMIESLDASSAHTKRVYVYPLKNADPSQVSTMLQGMFGSTSTGSRNGNRTTTTGSASRTSTSGTSSTNRNNTSGSRSSSGSSSPNTGTSF